MAQDNVSNAGGLSEKLGMGLHGLPKPNADLSSGDLTITLETLSDDAGSVVDAAVIDWRGAKQDSLQRGLGSPNRKLQHSMTRPFHSCRMAELVMHSSDMCHWPSLIHSSFISRLFGR